MTSNLTRDEAAIRSALITVASYHVDLDLTGGEETFGSVSVIRFDCTAPGSASFINVTDIWSRSAESYLLTIAHTINTVAGAWQIMREAEITIVLSPSWAEFIHRTSRPLADGNPDPSFIATRWRSIAVGIRKRSAGRQASFPIWCATKAITRPPSIAALPDGS